MNKCQFRLFFIVILSFIALDQKCSDDTKYFKKLPTESKIRKFCLNFPKKYHACSIGWIIGDLVNRKKHYNSKVTQSERLAYDFVMKNKFGILHNNNEDGLAYAIGEIANDLEFSLDQTLQETVEAMEMYSRLKKDVEKAKKEAKERLIKRNIEMEQMKSALLSAKKEANLSGNEFWLVRGES